MDNMASLSSGLPRRATTQQELQDLDTNLISEFKTAASAVTKLFKLAGAKTELSRRQGYVDALQDLLTALEEDPSLNPQSWALDRLVSLCPDGSEDPVLNTTGKRFQSASPVPDQSQLGQSGLGLPSQTAKSHVEGHEHLQHQLQHQHQQQHQTLLQHQQQLQQHQNQHQHQHQQHRNQHPNQHQLQHQNQALENTVPVSTTTGGPGADFANISPRKLRARTQRTQISSVGMTDPSAAVSGTTTAATTTAATAAHTATQNGSTGPITTSITRSGPNNLSISTGITTTTTPTTTSATAGTTTVSSGDATDQIRSPTGITAPSPPAPLNGMFSFRTDQMLPSTPPELSDRFEFDFSHPTITTTDEDHGVGDKRRFTGTHLRLDTDHLKRVRRDY
ncbi:hypothetical protein AWJ20_5286 [Sugiyamaella lignohabitans]|uniref:Uncharacterized protein n=1 Tax=Sugiyamaella lignohabitans TaxID=796027 RepID=A0A167EPR9_9ASCO|nr:uncharacterized protein AWJ20_5286 [Sugiyamaella lignohabitans]ANB14321.1 hypothetical protein AWJ20_5286 [Sugiyamaella lignohabitans]